MVIALFLIFFACPIMASQPAKEAISEIEMSDVAIATIHHEAPIGVTYFSQIFPKKVANVIDINDVIVRRILRDTGSKVIIKFHGMNGPATHELLLDKKEAEKLFYQLQAQYSLLEKNESEWLELIKQHRK